MAHIRKVYPRRICRTAIRRKSLIKVPYTKIINGKAYTLYRYRFV